MDNFVYVIMATNTGDTSDFEMVGAYTSKAEAKQMATIYNHAEEQYGTALDEVDSDDARDAIHAMHEKFCAANGIPFDELSFFIYKVLEVKLHGG